MQNWWILPKFAQKIQRNRLFFIDCFLAKFPPRNFPWNRPIFLRICPWKSFEIWLFSAKIPQNRPIFLRILTLLPRDQPIFPRILTFFPRNRPIFPRICPWKSHEILLFFLRNIRSPVLRTNQRVYHLASDLTLSVPMVTNINFLPIISIHHQEKKLWELIKWSPRINALIFYQILSTHSLRKCIEISLENLYVVIGA